MGMQINDHKDFLFFIYLENCFAGSKDFRVGYFVGSMPDTIEIVAW